MKTYVLGIKNGKAAVWAKNGQIRYIPDKGYQVGQLLDIPDAPTMSVIPGTGIHLKRSAIRYSIAVAASLIVATLGIGITATTATASTVTLGTEPQIEYRVNVFDRVVGVSISDASDRELEKAIKNRVRGKSLTEAIDIMFDDYSSQITLSENNDSIDISVSSLFQGKSEKLKEEAEDEIRARTQQTPESDGEKSQIQDTSQEQPDTPASPYEQPEDKPRDPSETEEQPEDLPEKPSQAEEQTEDKHKDPSQSNNSNDRPVSGDDRQPSPGTTNDRPEPPASSDEQSGEQPQQSSQTEGQSTDRPEPPAAPDSGFEPPSAPEGDPPQQPDFSGEPPEPPTGSDGRPEPPGDSPF
ncbi:MAG: hypothetical protein IJ695_07900 [Butyrivibrio sp.]|nr:hypothetical protein [Butyrivibrio sp.]